MLRKFTAAALIGAAGLVIVPGFTTPASAAGQCVSKAEYSHVHKGMTQSQVRRKLHGQTGKVSYQSSYSITREYKPCTSRRWGFVTIDFDNFNSRAKEVGYKSAYWG
jgi:hypothetical protein